MQEKAIKDIDTSQMRKEVTGVVVSGGRSRRMGTDKSFITLAGEPLIKRAVRLLEPFCEQIIIVTNQVEATKELGWPEHVNIVPDDIPYQGPLGGLSTAANHASTPYIFVRAVDMPWLAPGLFEMFYKRIKNSHREVVIPLSNRGNEPLCAMYKTEAVSKWVQKVLDTGRRRVISFFKYVRVDAVSQESIHEIDPYEDSFLNINHPDQIKDIDEELKRGDRLLPSEQTSRKSLEKTRGKDGGAFEQKPNEHIKIVDETAYDEEVVIKPSLREPKPSGMGNAITVLHNKPGAQALPTERPYTIKLNGVEISSVQATQTDLADMAVGFLVSEGLLVSRDDFKGADVDRKHGVIYVETKELDQQALAYKTSKRYITSGCGKGVTFSSIDDVTAFASIDQAIYIEPSDLHTWIQEMSRQSEAYKNSGGSHSCGLVLDGELKIVREDVGRHNAVDKVIGRAWLERMDLRRAVLLCTGRLSYEITAKSARQGIPMIASRSAATDLSVSIANSIGITLVGYVKSNQVVVYTHPERIVGGER